MQKNVQKQVIDFTTVIVIFFFKVGRKSFGNDKDTCHSYRFDLSLPFLFFPVKRHVTFGSKSIAKQSPTQKALSSVLSSRLHHRWPPGA